MLNYSGEWVENKYCIEIHELTKDHLYGYYYKSIADYEENHKDNNGIKIELKHFLDPLLNGVCWEGTLPINEHHGTKNYLSQYYFVEVNGY